MSMNGYQIAGDSLHLLAIIILLVKIWKNKSCAGVSGKSQILFAMTYMCRYLDLLAYFLSVYNSAMKIIFIGMSLTTCCLIFDQFYKTYDRDRDSFRIEVLILPAIILAYFFNHDFTALEILWTFSVYLESVAILPQFYLIWKIGEADNTILCYLGALGSYRALYILNWAYRYTFENHYDLIAITAGVVQTVLYLIFFILCAVRSCSEHKFVEDERFVGDGYAPVYVISGKYAPDVNKSNMKNSPDFKTEERNVFEPIDEKTPKTGLASFTGFSTNLTLNNAAEPKLDADAKNALTLVFTSNDNKSAQSEVNTNNN